jgi:hypothetical protein
MKRSKSRVKREPVELRREDLRKEIFISTYLMIILTCQQRSLQIL